MNLEIPKNLKYSTDHHSALQGERIYARMNKSKSVRVPHKKTGGRGQGIVLHKAICWIERKSDVVL